MLSAQSAILVFVGAAVLTAEPPLKDPALGGIVLGVVLDANSRLRPVFGVPGASTLGPPIALDAGIQVIAIAQDYILGIRGDAHELVVLAGSEPRGLDIGVTRAELSPRGSAAALLFDDGTAKVITGLPKASGTAWTPDLSALPAPPSSIAVSDDGSVVLAGVQSGDRVSIFLITAANGPRVVASVGQLAGLAFIPGTTGAVFGDAANGQVQLLQGIGGSMSIATVADGLAPISIASSNDGRQFFVATANPSGVIAIDRATGTQEVITCACDPTGLYRLGRSGLFRLTESSDGLFWLLDSGSATRRIVAVPPDAAPSDGGAQ